MQQERVRTQAGWLVGKSEGNVRCFKGIPYAAPPVGRRRWKPPAPFPAWTGERDAGRFGPSAFQSGPPGIDDITRVGGAPPPFSEDCLTLNVWAPVMGGKAPVMVWLHGGSGRMGAGSLPFYDGTQFARSGVVLVTVNFRLGHLGFFAHPALTDAAGPDEPLGSYGMMDQIAALGWVRDNIAAFGGDPGNVTLFGESMGGFHVLGLMTCPSARGLFHRAIVQSGGGWFPPNAVAKAERQGVRVAEALGLPGAEASADALRAIPPERLAAIDGEFHPIIDGRLMPADITPALAGGAANGIPLMIGVNSGEDSLLNYPGARRRYLDGFKPRRRLSISRLYGQEPEVSAGLHFRDMVFTAPARWVAGLNRKAATYLYLFDHVPPDQRAAGGRAAHGDEIFHIFRWLDRHPDGRPVTEADRLMSDRLHARWVAFARDGVPGDWPPHRPGDGRWMVFDTPDGRLAPHRPEQLLRVAWAAPFLLLLFRLRSFHDRLLRRHTPRRKKETIRMQNKP